MCTFIGHDEKNDLLNIVKFNISSFDAKGDMDGKEILYFYFEIFLFHYS